MKDNKTSFLKARRKGVGGSDVAGILGLSKWETPYSIYLAKVEGIRGEVPEELCYWGHALESPVADRFSQETGLKLKKVEETLVSKEHDFIIAHIDRDVVGENAGLEIKTASEYVRDEWNENIPAAYLLQCMHYIYVTGATHWYLAVLIGGNSFQFHRIERDEELIEMMVKKVVCFWENYVLAKEPPPIGVNDGCALNAKFAESGDSSPIELPLSCNDELNRLQELKVLIKDLEKDKDGIENRLKATLGTSTNGFTGEYNVSWNPRTTNRLDTSRFKKDHPDMYSKYTKESQFRVLKVAQIKSKTKS